MTSHKDFRKGDNDNCLVLPDSMLPEEFSGYIHSKSESEKPTSNQSGNSDRETLIKDKMRRHQPPEPAASRIKNRRAENLFAGSRRSVIRDHNHLFEANKNLICQNQCGVTHIPVRIDEVINLLSQSRTGQFLLAGHNDGGIKIQYDKQTNTALFDPTSRSVFINPILPKTAQVVLLARELRRAWQYRNRIMENPLKFEPEDAVMMYRIQIADSRVVATRVAWELKLSGRDDVWTEIMDSSLAPLAEAYATAARKDFRAVNNGMAARAAFDAWFDQNLSRNHDRRLIQEMLADELGYVFGGKGPGLEITTEWMIEIGELPFGQNYMVVQGSGLPIDTRYSSVRDRSNANFLWFIKFERSFNIHSEMFEDVDEEEIINEEKQEQNLRLQDLTDDTGKIVDFMQICNNMTSS